MVDYLRSDKSQDGPFDVHAQIGHEHAHIWCEGEFASFWGTDGLPSSCKCLSELEARVPIAIDIHLLHGTNRHAQPIVLQHLSERSTVDEVYWTCAFSRCLRGRSGAESPAGDKKPSVRSSFHGSAKRPDLGSLNNTGVPLALEYDMEANDALQSDNALTVNATVARAPGHHNLGESRLS